jgi:hypothetical protein
MTARAAIKVVRADHFAALSVLLKRYTAPKTEATRGRTIAKWTVAGCNIIVNPLSYVN